MKRRKTDRDNLIIKKILRGEYKIDIAKEFKISPSMITKIWNKYKVSSFMMVKVNSKTKG